MSYGVLASRNGQLLVETRLLGKGDSTEAALARFVERRGRTWSPGRFALTRLHLSYLPGPAARGAPSLNLDLTDIDAVEVGEGRITRTITLRTSTHALQLRTTGAQAFAEAISTAAEDARRNNRTRSLRR